MNINYVVGHKQMSRLLFWCTVSVVCTDNIIMGICGDSSASTSMGCGLDARCSIPSRGKKFFCTVQHLNWLWGAPSLLFNRYWGLTAHLHLVLRSRMVELYLYFCIHLHGVMLNELSIGRT
jgi:hypothetical protein